MPLCCTAVFRISLLFKKSFHGNDIVLENKNRTAICKIDVRMIMIVVFIKISK